MVFPHCYRKALQFREYDGAEAVSVDLNLWVAQQFLEVDDSDLARLRLEAKRLTEYPMEFEVMDRCYGQERSWNSVFMYGSRTSTRGIPPQKFENPLTPSGYD